MGRLSNEQFDGMDKKAKETVLASVKFAEKSEEPPLEKLYDYTYVDGIIEPARAEKRASLRRDGEPAPASAAKNA